MKRTKVLFIAMMAIVLVASSYAMPTFEVAKAGAGWAVTGRTNTDFTDLEYKQEDGQYRLHTWSPGVNGYSYFVTSLHPTLAVKYGLGVNYLYESVASQDVNGKTLFKVGDLRLNLLTWYLDYNNSFFHFRAGRQPWNLGMGLLYVNPENGNYGTTKDGFMLGFDITDAVYLAVFLGSTLDVTAKDAKHYIYDNSWYLSNLDILAHLKYMVEEDITLGVYWHGDYHPELNKGKDNLEHFKHFVGLYALMKWFDKFTTNIEAVIGLGYKGYKNTDNKDKEDILKFGVLAQLEYNVWKEFTVGLCALFASGKDYDDEDYDDMTFTANANALPGIFSNSYYYKAAVGENPKYTNYKFLLENVFAGALYAKYWFMPDELQGSLCVLGATAVADDLKKDQENFKGIGVEGQVSYYPVYVKDKANLCTYLKVGYFYTGDYMKEYVNGIATATTPDNLSDNDSPVQIDSESGKDNKSGMFYVTVGAKASI